MNDPWADVRARVGRAEEMEAAFPIDDLDKSISPRAQQAIKDVRMVLDDADALLEVIDIAGLRSWAVTITEEWNRVDSEQRLRMYASMKAAEKILAAIAALPEHLK